MPFPLDLPDATKNISIRDFILTDVPRVLTTDPFSAALDKYKKSSYQAVLVVDGAGSLVGMLTDNDLVGKASAGSVSGVLPKDPVIAARDNATLSDLLDLLNGANSKKQVLNIVPVVGPDNKPLGIVDRDKLTIRVGELLVARQI